METETWVDFVRNIRNILFFSLLFDQLRQFLILSGYISIILSFMRYLTFCTVFYSVLCKPEIPAAVFSQRIQRTITEETIKVLRIRAFMARKVFTLFVAEIRKMFPFPIWFFHLLSPRYIKKSSHGTAELVIFKTYFRGFAILLRGRQWIRSNMRRERMHPE